MEYIMINGHYYVIKAQSDEDKTEDENPEYFEVNGHFCIKEKQ